MRSSPKTASYFSPTRISCQRGKSTRLFEKEDQPMKTLHIDRMNTPVGNIFIITDGELLCALDYEEYEQRMRTLLQRRYGTFSLMPTANPHNMSDRLRAYFAGDHTCL